MEQKPAAPPNKNAALAEWVAHYRQQAVGPFIALGILSVINIVLILLTPIPIRLMFDAVFGNSEAPGFLDQYVKSEELLYWLAAMTVALFIAQRLARLALHYYENMYRFKLRSQVERDFYLHMLRLPQNVKKLHPNKDYSERLQDDAGAVADLFLTTYVKLAQSAGLLIGIVIVLLATSLSTSLLSLIIIPPLYVSIRRYARKRDPLPASRDDGLAKIKQFITESIAGSYIVQAFNRETSQQEHFYSMQTFLYKLRVKEVFLNNAAESIDGVLMLFALLVFIVVGGQAALNGYIAPGQLLIFIYYFSLLHKPLETIQASLQDRRKQQAAMRTTFDYIFDLPEQKNAVDNPVQAMRATGQLIYQNVTVLVNTTPLLKAVNLTVEPGQKVAIIGPGASGKSALLSLAPRLNTWASGNIYLDGRDVRMYDLFTLRQQFAYVEQEPVVFSDTIFGNVAFGKPEGQTNLAEATAALGAAGAYDYVKTLPRGLETTIGTAGEVKLTTGRKQQIAIARAFLHNAPVLLLDEPLSAVDKKDDMDILGSLTELMKGRTVLMVTHNLELLQQVDVIYVIENGILRDVNEYGGIAAYHDVLQALKPKDAPLE